MAQDTVQQAPAAPATPARTLLPLILPALVVGVGASLLLLGVSAAAGELQDVLWQDLPDALGVGRYSVLWMLVVLTATGVAVGLVVWKVPGHAGPDPATTGLAGQFATMAVVKLAALLVAASCGFRGGRIFPAVFVGTAFGLGAHALVPAVHPALGVAAGVLGMLLAITRQGWVSLFTAAVLVASPAILALLCIASLPAWLLVTGRSQMQLREDGTPLR
ncbi:hypothetical protein ACFYO2_33410 [Streptomyces sp. NPDC006602]|uniref:hypothetical protein n=1 Tax=Streptomyces sp. NPDC006602 TaxID=3364751 RepID=UPI00369206AC